MITLKLILIGIIFIAVFVILAFLAIVVVNEKLELILKVLSRR